jgi:RNA polymerase sigma-70 factor (ECF subfamily)
MAGEQAAGPTMTDEMLVQSTLSGEKAAFRELFDRYRAGAYRVAYRFVGNHEDAMDVAQEAFVKVHRSLASFEQRSQFRTWLMRIVTNTPWTCDAAGEARRRRL